MSTKTLDVSVLVHTPQESASNYVQWAKRIRQEPGIRWGVPYIDEVVIPMRGGDLVAFVARPGHCKTSMMMRQAMQVAQEIMRRDEQDQKAVAVVTYEQCQEELENFIQSNQTFSSTDVAWGRVPEDQLIQQVKNRADLPLWVIGHSMARAGTKKPAMTPETVLDAIKYIQDKHQRQVVLMTFDYVQLIPVTGGGSKTEQVTAAVPMIKNLALEIGAPAIIAVQASRDVDSLKFKIPQMHHAQWGCVTGDSRIVLADTGFEVRADALHDLVNTRGQQRVHALHEPSLRITGDAYVVAAKRNPPEPILRIDCGNHGHVRVNERHLFYAPDGWKLVRDLRPGDWIAKHATSDLLWVKIQAIHGDGYEPTYDFQVEHDHNYVVNGFVSHNSIIEQACDKVFSFWRPWQTEEQGATINLGPTYGNEQPVSANLLIVAMLKQRFGLGHKIWPMYFDPAYLKLAQMEFYHGDLLEDDEYGV